MNVFTTGRRNQPWVWQVTGLCFVLGLLLAASLQTVRSVNRSGSGISRIGVPPAINPQRVELLRQRDKEIAGLRQHNTELENALGKGTDQEKILNDELQRVKILAGLTAVKGPGIVISLQDSKKRAAPTRAFEVNNGLVHDVDLRQVVDELGQSGAEAIAINNQRIVGRTFVRCVGPTILVNSVPLVPPYVIHAIGDPDTLWGGLNLPYGVLDNMRRYDPLMFKIERKKEIVIPAYTGSTEVRFAKPSRSSDEKGREDK